MPFCTTSSAAPTTSLTLALASKLCGSVLGLLSAAVTRTYFPPIWEITSAYSFSAPTATTVPVVAVAVLVAELAEQAAASSLAAAATAGSAAARRGPCARGDIALQCVTRAAGGFRSATAVLITNENDNQYGEERQAGHGHPGVPAGAGRARGGFGAAGSGGRTAFPDRKAKGRSLAGNAKHTGTWQKLWNTINNHLDIAPSGRGKPKTGAFANVGARIDWVNRAARAVLNRPGQLASEFRGSPSPAGRSGRCGIGVLYRATGG